nr:hypothetical protein [Tanacetum cinerariifolium]
MTHPKKVEETIGIPNEVCLLRERNQDPLAFVVNQQMTPPHFNTYQSSYNNPQIQQKFPPSQYGSIHPSLAVLAFSLGDDPIDCLNKAMAFLTVVDSSRGNNRSGYARVVKCYNCQGEGHMARKYTQPKQQRNAACYKDKAMLAEAHEAVLMANISNYGSDLIFE